MKTQGQKRALCASALSISEESTLDLLYSTETCRHLSDSNWLTDIKTPKMKDEDNEFIGNIV